jgi:hypothetical protein
MGASREGIVASRNGRREFVPGLGYLLTGGQFKANGHSVGIDASVYFGR